MTDVRISKDTQTERKRGKWERTDVLHLFSICLKVCAATTCRRGKQTHGSDFIGCICGALETDSEY